MAITNATPGGIFSGESRLQLGFWIFVVAYCIVAAMTLTPDHRWGDDWAQYVLHARNLANGHPYPDTGYLFNPEAANVGPPSYPPGLPLLLAPFVAVFGVNLIALKVVGVICMGLALLVTLRLVAPVTGMPVALVSMVLVALHPIFWMQREAIQSEAPYMLFSMLALWWCSRPADDDASRGRALIAGMILGALLYASVISRAIGITLIPALLVYGWAQRKPFGWFIGLGVSFLLLLWLQTIWLVAPPTYASELKVPTASVITLKPGGYLIVGAEYFPLPFGLSRVAAAAILLASVAGAWFASTQPRPGAQSAGLRALVARVPLIVWYLGSYFSALILASVEPDTRLLLPLLPIGVPLVVYAVSVIANRFARPRPVLTAAGLLGAVYLVALLASGRYAPREQMATCKECREMFSYIREHTAPGTVIVFHKPRAMALLGDRPSWTPSFRYTREELEQRLERLRAQIIVEGVPGSEFALRYPAAAVQQARVQESDAEVVFSNDAFVVRRLRAIRPGS